MSSAPESLPQKKPSVIAPWQVHGASLPLVLSTVPNIERILAMFETVFLVAAADGQLRAKEVEQMRTMLSALTKIEISKQQCDAVLDACALWLDHEDYDQRVAHVASVISDPVVRRETYVMAVGIVLLDGKLGEEEVDILTLIEQAFGISSQEGQKIQERVGKHLQSLSSTK